MTAPIRPTRPACAALLLAGFAGSARAADAPSIAWPEPGGRATISRPFKGSPLAVGVSSRTAGAIDSLTWGGTQFINARDHGRELQSAAAFDGYGECLNPTEAGSDADGRGDDGADRRDRGADSDTDLRSYGRSDGCPGR